MNDKPVQREIGSLSNDLAKEGLSTTAEMLHRAIGDRSVLEHEKWDAQRQQLRDVVVEALAEGIHTIPQTQLELPLDDLRHVQGLPPQELGSLANANAGEVQALEASGAILKKAVASLLLPPFDFRTGWLRWQRANKSG